MLRVVGIALVVSAAFAQSRPECEVASVKPAPEPDQRQVFLIQAGEAFQNSMPTIVPHQGRTVSIEQHSLRQLVAMAYKLRPSEVAGPSWISDVHFNIEAKLPEGADWKQENDMLKALLEERFGLRVHAGDQVRPRLYSDCREERPQSHARAGAACRIHRP